MTGGAGYLVRGDDPSLVAQAARSLIERLVGDRDPALVVEEHGGPSADALEVGAVVDALLTPPFLVDRRVVVVRDAGRIVAADAPRLVAALADPMPTTTLILVGGGGTVPQALVKAVQAAGEVVETAVGNSRGRKQWLATQLGAAPVRLNAAATARLSDHLGSDLGRMAGLLQTLASVYGEGATVGVDELEPFLGSAGDVPPWELTDAIDAGSTAAALGVLHRMMGAGGRVGPELVAVLARHFSQMLRLDGHSVTSPEEAAALLGVNSPFVARKALAQAERLGSQRVGQAVMLIADADLDIKGRSGLPPEVVMEVLVARLSRLVRPVPSSGRSRRRQ